MFRTNLNGCRLWDGLQCFSPFATLHHLQAFNKHSVVCHLLHPKHLVRGVLWGIVSHITEHRLYLQCSFVNIWTGVIWGDSCKACFPWKKIRNPWVVGLNTCKCQSHIEPTRFTWENTRNLGGAVRCRTSWKNARNPGAVGLMTSKFSITLKPWGILHFRRVVEGMYIEKEQRWGSSFKGWRICWFFYGESLYLLGEVFFWLIFWGCVCWISLWWCIGKDYFLVTCFIFLWVSLMRDTWNFLLREAGPLFFRGAFKREKKTWVFGRHWVFVFSFFFFKLFFFLCPLKKFSFFIVFCNICF